MGIQIPEMTYWVCTVTDVHDGDTVRFDIDQGLGSHQHEWIRLKGVYAEEKPKPGWEEARQVLAGLLGGHGPIFQITTERLADPIQIRERRTFVRYVGRVRAIKTGFVINQLMVDLGYIDKGTGT